MRALILYFLLLILKIALNFGPDVGHKWDEFFEVLLKKSLKFVPNKESGPITLNLGFMLLPTEVDLILEKQSCKENALMAYGTSCVKIILALLTKVIPLYMQAFIIQVEISGF